MALNLGLNNSDSEFLNNWSLKESYPMYIAEFIGTLILSMTFGISTNYIHYIDSSSNVTFIAPIAVGFCAVSMVYAFGHISGAHLNPAVTIAVWIRGFISPLDTFLFITVQIFGGIGGAFLAWMISNECPYIQPADDVNLGRAFVAELMYTFTICVVVINVATTESQRGNFFYGVAIGMALATGMAAVQSISGGAFNPAIGTAFSITNALRTKGTIKYIWLYWLAPMLGGIIGGLSFFIINAKEYKNNSMEIQQQNGY